MPFNYKPLWKQLIDRGMKKKELREKANISKSTMDKMYKEENISLDVIGRICEVLDCKIEEVVEYTRQEVK